MGMYGNYEGIKELGEDIKERCLINGRSLLTDEPIWTRDNFIELKAAYNDQPDESSRTFDQKLERQLRDVTSGARQLFAELYLVDMLVLGNVLAETKIKKIDTLLKDCEPPLSLVADDAGDRMKKVTSVLREGGVLNGGQGFNTQRWKQMAFLVSFGCDWFEQVREERIRLMSSGDGIDQAIFELPLQHDSPMQRALAYILAPDEFVAITSGKHLRLLLKHFGPQYPDVSTSSTESRVVGAIQNEIRKTRGPEWHFYVDPDEWNPRVDTTVPKAAPRNDPDLGDRQGDGDPDGEEGGEAFALPLFGDGAAESLLVDSEWLKDIHALLERRRQLVLQGPPGTGKTYLARRMAKMLAGSNEHVKLVQFHPAYTYEDFFEGFRPSESGTLVLRDGPLKSLAQAANEDESGAPYFLIIDEINRGNLARIFGELYFLLEYRDESVQLMYSQEEFSLPSNLYIIATMNSVDRSIAVVDSAMRRRFAFASLDPQTRPTNSVLSLWCARENVSPKISAIWRALNNRIAQRDPAAVIGPSYLMREGVESEDVLERIWEFEILPQVRESFFGTGDWVDRELALNAIRSSVDEA